MIRFETTVKTGSYNYNSYQINRRASAYTYFGLSYTE